MDKCEPGFGEFVPPAVDEWLNALRSEPGLQWQLGDEISVSPAYSRNESTSLRFPYADALPASWKMLLHAAHLPSNDIIPFIERCAAVGADNIEIPASACTEGDLSDLLSTAHLLKLRLHFCEVNEPLQLLERVKNICVQKNIPCNTLASIDFSPLLTSSGSLEPEEDWFELCVALLKSVSDFGKEFRCFCVPVSQWQNGDNMHAALCAAHTYLLRFNNSQVDAAGRIFFKVRTGPGYITEIARLRALRWLWCVITGKYKINTGMHIRCAVEPQSAYHELIAASTMSMSAVIGGCNSLCITSAGDTEAGQRLALNVQHILKRESHLDAVRDPAAGAYLIERLTAAIAEKNWKAFCESESSGGFPQALPGKKAGS